jgi:predicted nuclease of predicted toxin-antitoxin system
MLSPKVARALAEIGFRVDHVGGEGQPPKKSTDGEVLDHARKCQQIIVTNNHDMIVLCAEEEASVVWLGPRRSLNLDEQVLACFMNIANWDRLLGQQKKAVCLRAFKTATKVLSLEQASRLAMERIRRAKRPPTRRKATKPSPGLWDDDPEA